MITKRRVDQFQNQVKYQAKKMDVQTQRSKVGNWKSTLDDDWMRLLMNINTL